MEIRVCDSVHFFIVRFELPASKLVSVPIFSLIAGGAWAWSTVEFLIFFIVKFEFPVPKLVTVPIFSLIGRVSILGVGAGMGGVGVGFKIFLCHI